MPAQPGGAVYVRQRHDDDLVETETELAQRVLKMSTPMLASAIVHMLLLIVLGLWMFQEHFRVEIEIIASSDGNEDIFDSVAVMASPLESVSQLEAAPLMTVAKTDPFASNAPIDPFGTAPKVNMEGAMAGRSETAQNYMVGKRGGNKASQSAVGNGLKWLADNQDKKTGKWKLQGLDRKGNNDLVLNENFQAATAMALLAFQGAGHTHRSGKYAANVDRGLTYLLGNQTSDGNFCSRGVARDEVLYAHAQCTIAVCELLAMTKDEKKLRKVAEDAVKFCIDSQDLDENTGGGWRYTPGRDSDTSVTGWMLVALKSATYAGIAVPTEVFNRINNYLDHATNEDGFKVTVGGKDIICAPGVLYRYYLDKPPDRVMTAEGILMRQYLGWNQDDPRIAMAAEILLSEGNLPKWEERDVYYWYYATQMFSHLDGEPWKKWNGVMRDLLVQKQIQEGGEKGSWNPYGTGTPNPLVGADYWCANGCGGRHYVTCMSLYILEVYYRHLPIYQIKGRDKTVR